MGRAEEVSGAVDWGAGVVERELSVAGLQENRLVFVGV